MPELLFSKLLLLHAFNPTKTIRAESMNIEGDYLLNYYNDFHTDFAGNSRD